MIAKGESPPLVSIIMPAFNASATIADSIRSVQAQSYSEWELLVINDASSDATLSIVGKFSASDPRIRVINEANNKGVSASRNIGLNLKRGAFVAFLDADDLWLPQKLEVQMQAMFEGAVFSYTAYQRVNWDGEFLSNYYPPERVDFSRLLLGNPFGMLTVLINASLLDGIEFSNIGHEDYALWLAILKKGIIAKRAGENRVYAKYRVHKNSISSSKLKAALWQWHLYRKYLRLSILKSTTLMISYGCFAIAKRM